MTGESGVDLHRNLDRWLAEPDPGDNPASGRLAFVFSWDRGRTGRPWDAGRAARYPAFRDSIERTSRLFESHTGFSLSRELAREDGASQLHDTGITQPAIFAIQIALAELWQSWGIVPDVIVGHSLGEAAAAVAGGALALEDGVRLVYHRSRLMKQAAGKGMTAVVGLPLDRALEAIHGREDRVGVAGCNGPVSSVLSGDPDALRAILQALEAQGVFCRPVAGVDIAFHSPQMEPLKQELVAALAGLAPRAAAIPLVSTVTGRPIEGAALDADYWGRNLREPFLFAQALAHILGEGCVGVHPPHPVLSSAIVQNARISPARLKVLPSMRRAESEITTLFGSLRRCTTGQTVNWKAVYPGGGPVVALPHYPWQRERYWLDQLPGGGPEEQLARPSGSHPLLGTNDRARRHG